MNETQYRGRTDTVDENIGEALRECKDQQSSCSIIPRVLDGGCFGFRSELGDWRGPLVD